MQIQWMDLRRLFEILLHPKPKYESVLFSTRGSLKSLYPLSISAQRRRPITFPREKFNENLRSSPPHPFKSLCTLVEIFLVFPFFFFFFVSSDYFDEWIRDSKRGAFLTGSISREPPQFLWKRRMRTISIHPPRMDGRNFEGEATMMQVSDVFQWWALPVGMVGEVILSFASRFSFLFARKAKKWTKIYQVSFYYL